MPITAGPFIPGGTTFPVVEDTYVSGANKCVADTTERDAIPESCRKVGMRVYDYGADKTYILFGGLDNTKWVELVQVGTASPEGSVTGLYSGQVFTQFVTLGDGSAPARMWVFNGLLGTNTGWA